MGHITYFNGEIKLKNKEAIEIINKMIKDDDEQIGYGEFDLMFDEGDKTPEEVSLSINCDWKNYNDDMEKLCLFVAMLDNEAEGVIDCSGDESDDRWRIIIGKGKVFMEQGRVIYEDEEQFENSEIKKKVYEITKDKSLLKEVMLESLE